MLDSYQIINLITKDQLGGIYLAKDTILQHEIEFRNFDATPDISPSENWQTDFTTFASQLIALRHLNLVPVYDAAIDEDAQAIIITQHLETTPVSELIKQEALPLNEVVTMANDLLLALDAAHSAHIFHGALHTASVKRLTLSTKKHRYLLSDLGMKHLSSIVMGETTNIEDPILIPPEIYGNPQAANVQSDLFMIGQLCYTALIGGHPFAEMSAEKCAQAFASRQQPALSQFVPDIPQPLETWITQLISPKPKNRPNSAKEALNSLKKSAPPNPTLQTKGSPQRSSSPPSGIQIGASTPSSKPPLRSKRKTQGIIAGALLIFIALSTILVKGINSEPNNRVTTEDSSAKKSDTTQKNQKTSPIQAPELIAHRQIAPLPIQGKPTSKPTPVNPKGTLDWLVTNGTHATQNHLKKPTGTCMLSLANIGRIQEVALPGNQLRIQGKKHTPSPYSATDTYNLHAKAGQGWKLTFRTPKQHHGDLLVSFFLTQQGCDIAFKIGSPNQKTTSLTLKATEPGIFIATIKLPNTAPAKFYTIDVTAAPATTAPAPDFTMGLHGLRIKKP